MWAALTAYAALAWELITAIPDLTWRWTEPTGSTLQERYPAAPGAFVTSYSSIDLQDEAFVPAPRHYRPDGTWTPCPPAHCRFCGRCLRADDGPICPDCAGLKADR